MAFPLVLLPKRVMYVEDAVSFLEVLRLTMSNKHSREFVDSAHIALMTFAKEALLKSSPVAPLAWAAARAAAITGHLTDVRDMMGEAV